MRKLAIASIAIALALGLFATPSLAMRPESNGMMNLNFVAHLDGKLWTSRFNGTTYGPIDTLAQGQVMFHVSNNGEEIEFMLIVANIQNITMAHIHFDNGAPVGPIVVWLYPRTPPLKEIPGRFDGILMKGTIRPSDFVGLLEGKTISDLVQKMEEGNAYVVVHTAQHPPGEIRGWIH